MKNIIATSKAPSAIGPYSQGVGTGSMVYTSGQIPLDPATGKLVEGGIEEQAHQALKNLGEVLKAGGADYANVVKTTVFLTDLGNFKALNEIYAQYFTQGHPARSCIEISALPLGSLVEIEAVALLG